jgi:multiple sugar transport system substrate-binding protein
MDPFIWKGPPAARLRLGGRVTGRQILVSVALILLLVLAACSPPSDVAESDGEGRLDFTVWSYSIETINDNIKNFEEANPGVQVNLSDHSFFDYHDIMATNFTGGGAPDVAYSSDHWLNEWVAAGWIAPLNEHCPETTTYEDEWAPYATEGMTLDGNLYGLPYYADLLIFIYNERMLREAGFDAPPQTWEELTEQAMTMKQKGISETPINIPLTKADPWTIEIFYSMVYSIGGHMFDQSGNPVFNEPGGAAETALQWLSDARNTQGILDSASVEMAEPDVVKVTGAGRHAFTVLAKYNLAELNLGDHQEKGNFKMALMPGETHSTVGFVRFYALSSAAVDAGEQKVQSACDFLNYFGGKTEGEYEVVKRWALEKGLGFANLPLYDDPEIQEAINSWGDADLERQQAEIAQTKEGLTPFWGTWDIYAREQINAAVGGQIDATEALKNMADRWEQLAEEQG